MQEARVGPFQLRHAVARHDDERLWLAERVAGDRPPRWVAVRQALAPSTPASERLLIEYDTLRRVADPRLPQVIGHFPGRSALAVGWVPGQGLDRIAAAHRAGRITLDAATVLELVAEVAACLRAVHLAVGPTGAPLVHGHLHLRSIRLASDGAVGLLGLGRPHRAPPPETTAPEVLAGAPPTPAADRWAVGAVLVELLGGRPLLAGASSADRLEGRVEPWVEPLAAVNPELGRLLGHLLAVEPAARLADDGELVRQLRQIQRRLAQPADRAGLAQALQALPDLATIDPPAEEPAAEPAPAGPAERAAVALAMAPLAAAPDAPPAPTPPAPAASPAPRHPAAAAAAEVGPDSADEAEYTEPLHPGLLPSPAAEPPRPALRRPATAQRLGLGELLALGAIAALLLAAVAVLVSL